MKKKILILAVISIALTFVIYNVLKTDKLTLVGLGDSIARGISPYGVESYSYNDYIVEHLEKAKKLDEYYREFTNKDLRIHDLINMIKNNEDTFHNDKKITIQQALVKADIITLSIGSYDLYNYLGITGNNNLLKNNQELNKYFISMFTDLNELIQLIKKYTPGKIVIIGFYNPQLAPQESMIETFDFLDKSYQKVATENNCEYISINSEISGNEKYLPNSENYHLNYKGYQYISKKIVKQLKL